MPKGRDLIYSFKAPIQRVWGVKEGAVSKVIVFVFTPKSPRGDLLKN